MVWGAIMGDICGSPYENSKVESVFIKGRKMPIFTKDSTFTDDTVMSVAVCNILLTGSDIVDTFHRYFDLYPNAGYGETFGRWCLSKDTEPFSSYGNGALMRISPCAYYSTSLAECLEKAYEITNATHNHEDSLRAVKSYITLLWKLKNKALKKEEIKAFLLEDDYDITTLTIPALIKNYEFDVSCQGSYPQSVLAFAESESMEDCFTKIISLAGDTDTMCCIAGAIGEIYYGLSDEQLNKTKSYLPDELIEVVDTFYESYIL